MRGLLGTGPPDPTLESASLSPPKESIWHQNRVKSGNRCRINVKSMLNRCQIDPRGGEGEADSRATFGGSVPNKPLTSLVQHRRIAITSELASQEPNCQHSERTVFGSQIAARNCRSLSDFPLHPYIAMWHCNVLFLRSDVLGCAQGQSQLRGSRDFGVPQRCAQLILCAFS